MASKVSVVIPVYNAEEYLGECLDSILLQTLQDIEVICVDDGSTDDSFSCLQGYTFLDSRLKVIHQEKNGWGTACNRGLKEAKGEYIIFLNAKDFFESDMLEKMVIKAEKEKTDIVICGDYVFDDQLQKVSRTNLVNKRYLTQSVWTTEELAENLFTCCTCDPWNRLIRSEIIKKNELQFGENVCADDIVFTCLVMACAEKITMMEDPFVYNRSNMLIQPTENRKTSLTDTLKELNHLYNKLEDLNLLKNHLIGFLMLVRGLLYLGLFNKEAGQKRLALKSIRTTLLSKVYDQIFSCSTPAISIIIPAYNAAQYLPECLDSCLNQTLKNIEIICVDDGSTDNTLEILNQYAAQDKRVKVIHQENSGQAVARNTAFEKATGQLIQFLDADDYLDEDTCECIYTYMSIYGLEMCQIAAVEFNDSTGKEFEEPYHILQWLPEKFQPVFNYQNLLSCFPKVAVTACLTCYHRIFLIRNKIEWIHTKRFYEDTPFFIEALLKAKSVGALSDKFYHRRVHPNAVTQNMVTNFKDYTEIVKYTLNMILKINQEENIFLSYTDTLLMKAWRNFARFLPQNQMRHASSMYTLCLHIIKKYHYSLPEEIRDWCLRYAKSKGNKKLLKLKFYLLLVKLNRPDYTINLIQVLRKPEWCVKVFGLPVFQVIRSPMQLDPEELPLQKKVKKAEEIFYKICGLSFLKVEKKDLYG